METRANSVPAGEERLPPRPAPRRLHPAWLGAVALLLIAASAASAWLLRERWQRPAPRNEAGPSSATTNTDAKRGRLLYQMHCQSCHGPEGHGDGSAAVEMKPPPRDFAAAPWKFGATDEAVQHVIRDGSPGTAMPGFPLLSESERAALAAFVVSLAPPEAKETPRLSAKMANRLRRLGFVPEERLTFAPDLGLRDLDGRPAALARWRGKVVLLNFWGSTCVHCLAELPELEKVAHEVGADFAVVPVCFDETDATEVRRLVRRSLRELPVYVNPDGLARARYDVQTMPSLYLLDPAGRLLGHASGARSWSAADLRELVRAMKE